MNLIRKVYNTNLFPVYIITDSIDPYIAYRLIEPGYESWHEMDIRQRALNCFKEDIIISSNMNEKGCVNCHSFCNYSLQSSCFMHGLLQEGQSLLKITSLPKCNYRNSDHPKKELIPTGIHRQIYHFFQPIPPVSLFYSRNPNLIEVHDPESDLVLYDLVHNTVITDPRFNGPASFETFPAWAPDGKRLYYCTAPAGQLPKRLKEIKYSICSVSFNPDNGSFGEQSTRSIRHTIKALHSPYLTGNCNICFSPNRIMQLSRSGIRKRI